jgi:hypothetical protein
MQFEDNHLRLPVCRKRQSVTLNGSKGDYSVVKVPCLVNLNIPRMIDS